MHDVYNLKKFLDFFIMMSAFEKTNRYILYRDRIIEKRKKSTGNFQKNKCVKLSNFNGYSLSEEKNQKNDKKY